MPPAPLDDDDDDGFSSSNTFPSNVHFFHSLAMMGCQVMGYNNNNNMSAGSSIYCCKT
jgi:hypothetical protein